MIDFEEKDLLIEKIRSHHPGMRPDKYKRFGWYRGGMEDSGGWHYEVMIKSPIEDLVECLDMLDDPNKYIDPDLLEMRKIESENALASYMKLPEPRPSLIVWLMRHDAERDFLFQPEAQRLAQYKAYKNKSL